MSDTDQGFSKTTVIFHWIIAIAIIGMLIFGTYIADLPRGHHKAELIRIHKSIGMLILLVAGYRFLRRIGMGFPPEVAGARYKDFEKVTAKLVQWALLLGTVLMPIAGITGSLGGGHPVEVFTLFSIPAPAHKIPLLAKAGLEVHAAIGYVLMGAVTLHLLGALKHHVFDRDNTLRRMLGQRSQA